MRAIYRLSLLAIWGAALWAIGTAMTAEASPAIRLQMPFADLFTQDDSTTPQSYGDKTCRISGEEGLRIERDASDPCLAADATPGGACFDRLGLGTLRARRALLPDDDGQRCAE